MDELKEIKRRLEALSASNNGCVSIDDVKNVIAFIDGLIYENDFIKGLTYEKENKDGTGDM